MPGHDIVVIGASAGGVETLTELMRLLPPELPAAFFIVLHVPPRSTSALPRILSRHSRTPAHHPIQGEPIRTGQIYVAPPDYHLLIRDGVVELSRGPSENGHRPAIDALFRSAARSYGSRVVGVVLSGVLGDGTAGLQAVKMRGGVTVVQDPEEALYSGMPRNAIENVRIDYVLPIAEIAALLAQLALTPMEPAGSLPATTEMETEVEAEEMEGGAVEDAKHPGMPSTFGCPTCGGALWEITEGDILRFCCRVGHSWLAESLLIQQEEALEEALWRALRTLEESASLNRRMAERANMRGHKLIAERFETQAEDVLRHAHVIRSALKGWNDIAVRPQELTAEGTRESTQSNTQGNSKENPKRESATTEHRAE